MGSFMQRGSLSPFFVCTGPEEIDCQSATHLHLHSLVRLDITFVLRS